VPCGEVCAPAGAVGSAKTIAKAADIAATLIRIIAPTMNLLPAATSPIAAPRSTAGFKTVGTITEPGLERHHVDICESALAGRDGGHGARRLRAPAENLSRSVRGRDHPCRRFPDRGGARRDGGGERIRSARPVRRGRPAVPQP